jgi:hypothetical protein
MGAVPGEVCQAYGPREQAVAPLSEPVVPSTLYHAIARGPFIGEAAQHISVTAEPSHTRGPLHEARGKDQMIGAKP